MSLQIARRALTLAQVPPSLHTAALQNMQQARDRARGLTMIKLRARLAAKRIAQQLPWEAETVGDVLPALANYGVAPNLGNGVNGDNVPWAECYRMPDGSLREVPHRGKPRAGELPAELKALAEADLTRRRAAVLAAGGVFSHNAPASGPLELNRDPASLDWQTACARNYWGGRFWSGGAGKHPRSVQARTAWLRSNGGDREAWARGLPVDGFIDEWRGQVGVWRADVLHQSGVWLIDVRRQFGPLLWHWRLGFEIDNARHAHPRPGFDKRAPVTWGGRPERGKT